MLTRAVQKKLRHTVVLSKGERERRRRRRRRRVALNRRAVVLIQFEAANARGPKFCARLEAPLDVEDSSTSLTGTFLGFSQFGTGGCESCRGQRVPGAGLCRALEENLLQLAVCTFERDVELLFSRQQ